MLFFIKIFIFLLILLIDVDFLKFLPIILPLILSIAFLTLLERKVLGSIQDVMVQM